MLARVASVTDPKNVKVIVSNHAEMDHSGSLPQVIDIIKPDKVYASQMGVQNLAAQLHHNHLITPVKDAETLKLGGLGFTFLETKMLHWPDSMMTGSSCIQPFICVNGCQRCWRSFSMSERIELTQKHRHIFARVQGRNRHAQPRLAFRHGGIPDGRHKESRY